MIDIPEHRQCSKMDWQMYRKFLSSSPLEIPSKLDPAALELLVNKLYDNIEAAIDKACPTAPESQNSQSTAWF